MQIFEPVFEIRLVVSPSQPVHSGSGILLEFVERLPEQLDGDMVEERDAHPYRRFAAVLTDCDARRGADMDRYSFIVSDLHRLLVAGLPAHCEKLWTPHRSRMPSLHSPRAAGPVLPGCSGSASHDALMSCHSRCPMDLAAQTAPAAHICYVSVTKNALGLLQPFC